MTKRRDHAGARSARPQRSTRVQDVLSEWETDARLRLKRPPRTIKQVKQAMLALSGSAGVSDVRAITPMHVMEWLMLQPSTSTAMHRRSLVSMVFLFAQMCGVVHANPAKSVSLPRRRPGSGADCMTIEQAAAVIDVARKDVGDQRKTGDARARFYLFLWATGFRFNEARKQRWDDIDWDRGIMRVTADKAIRGDEVVLAKWFIDELKLYPRTGERIFMRAPSAHSLVRDYRKAGVFGKGRFHRWRKGAITWLAEQGVPLYELAKFSRHRSISVLTKSYIRTECRQLFAAQSLMAPARLAS